MKPLVNYCRWQGVVLRLRGRDDTAVWGHLINRQNDPETSAPFHFDLKTRQLTLHPGENEERIQLDDMGVVVKDAAHGA